MIYYSPVNISQGYQLIPIWHVGNFACQNRAHNNPEEIGCHWHQDICWVMTLWHDLWPSVILQFVMVVVLGLKFNVYCCNSTVCIQVHVHTHWVRVGDAWHEHKLNGSENFKPCDLCGVGLQHLSSKLIPNNLFSREALLQFGRLYSKRCQSHRHLFEQFNPEIVDNSNFNVINVSCCCCCFICLLLVQKKYDQCRIKILVWGIE